MPSGSICDNLGLKWEGEKLMSRQEQIAWFTASVVLVAATVFLVMIPVFGMPRATAAFSILALLGFIPLLAWRRRGDREVMADERDRAINSKATLIGYTVFWLFFVLSCMVPYTMYNEQGSMPVEVLPLILWLGFSVLQLVRAVATIVQYRRGLQNA
jgi:uncharacterized Tic20 family protein